MDIGGVMENKRYFSTVLFVISFNIYLYKITQHIEKVLEIKYFLVIFYGKCYYYFLLQPKTRKTKFFVIC